MSYMFQAFRPILSDFLSTILFVAFFALTHDIVLSIAAAIAIGIGQILWLKLRKRPIDAMQWMSLGLVIVLGGASLLTSNPRFVMVKPTIGGVAIACVMLRPGWMIRYMPSIVTANIRPFILSAFGYLWAFAIFGLAMANLVVALAFPPTVWAWFAAVVPLSVQLSLFALQFFSIRMLVRRSIRARMAAETQAF